MNDTVETYPTNANAPEERAFFDDLYANLPRVLNRRKALIALCLVLGLGIGASYQLLRKPSFESRAEVLLMQNDSGAMASGISMKASESVSEELLATHMKLLQSNRIVTNALIAAGLDRLPGLSEQIGPEGKPEDYIVDNLYVTSGGSGDARNAHVLNVAFKHADPEEAQVILTAVLNEYKRFTQEKFSDVNEKAAELIAEAREELEADIASIELEYQQFRLNSPLITGGREGADIFTARFEELAAEYSQLSIQIDQARGRLDLVKTRLDEFSEDNSHDLQKLALIDERNAERLGILVSVEQGQSQTASFQAMQPERAAGASAEYNALLNLKTRLKQLRSEFGPAYPETRALEEQISEMEQFLDTRSEILRINTDQFNLTPDDVMEAYITMLEHDLRALEQQSADTKSQMLQAETEAKDFVKYQLENDRLLRERIRSEDLYNSVIERLRNINLQKESTSIVQEIIDEPDVGEKVEPRPSVAATLAIISSLLFSAVGIAFAEYRDYRIHDSKELEAIFRTRVLGHVCNFEKSDEVKKLKTTLVNSKSTLSPYLITHHLPGSRVSESFRAIRTQVLFSLGGVNKIIGFTSANSGAGKSTLASNFAVSLATAGNKVLLVDCDMRLPQVHRIFGISQENGLSEAIQQHVPVGELLVGSEIPNLTLLPAGAIPANPAELLSSPEFKNLMRDFSENYAYVVLDCPPVLPVSDPSILAPVTDGMLFVSVVSQDAKPHVVRAEKILRGVGGKVLGCLVNRVDSGESSYEYRAYGYEASKKSDNYFAD
jgi:capsular exopolysaccharide synthesis family protein